MPGGDAPIPSYCEFAPGDPWHGPYHEREYGFPIGDEQALFGRLSGPPPDRQPASALDKINIFFR